MARGRPSKKGLIAQAAQRLFRVSGYQGTSIDQVVIEAGVSKPTVYSNYPSKLLLWQEVLQQLISQSQAVLEREFDHLVAQDSSFSDGWLAFWQVWCSCPDRLAAYRIHWGEAHKFTASECSLFGILEQVLEQHLKAWMSYRGINTARYFALNAVAREAFLIQKLSSVSSSEDIDLKTLLDKLSQ